MMSAAPEELLSGGISAAGNRGTKIKTRTVLLSACEHAERRTVEENENEILKVVVTK